MVEEGYFLSMMCAWRIDRYPSSLSKSAVHASHRDQWHRKSLHGQWPNLLDSLKADSYKWLQSAHLKPVTEALITAAQAHCVAEIMMFVGGVASTHKLLSA